MFLNQAIKIHSPLEVLPHRSFLTANSGSFGIASGILVLARQKPDASGAWKMGLYALNLRKPRWRRVCTQNAPVWSGNFGAALVGEGRRGGECFPFDEVRADCFYRTRILKCD